MKVLLTHFNTPWKRQKTSGFLTFSVGVEIESQMPKVIEESSQLN